MKQVCLLALLLLGCSFSQAQNTMSAAASAPVDSYRFDNVAKEVRKYFSILYAQDGEGDTAHYQRWLNFWEGRVCNNVPDSVHITSGQAASIILDQNVRFDPDGCLGNDGDFHGDWHCMGPYRNSYGSKAYNGQRQGRIEAIWVDPADTNYILAGSCAGGLWKSVDGGRNWTNITDQSNDVITGTMGIVAIAVDPQNHNNIYLATGTQHMFVSHWNGNYGLGLIYSTDGGQTWQADMDFRSVSGTLQQGGASGGNGTDWVQKIAYRPNSQELYAIAGKRIFVKPSPGQSWQEITPAFLNQLNPLYRLTDFEFTHDQPQGQIVFSTNCRGTTQYLLTYDQNGSTTWQSQPVVIPGYITIDNNYGWGINTFGLSASNVAYMHLFLAKATDSSPHDFLYKVSTPSGTPVLVKEAGMKSINEIIVSPQNDNLIYISQNTGGNPAVKKSTDGGSTFSDICETHADGRCLVLYKATNSSDGVDDILFAGTDGGISKKSAGEAKFHSITGDGMCITQFYGLSSDPSDDRYMTAGAQDNGSQSYNARNADPWDQPIVWGDGIRPAFANNGVNIAYAQRLSPKDYMRKFTFSGSSTTDTDVEIPPDDNPLPSFLHRVKFDQNNLAKVGYHYIWQEHIGDNSWNPTFGQINLTKEPKPWPLGSDRLNEKRSIDFIFPEQDPNVAYLAYFGVTWNSWRPMTDTFGRLYYSTNINSASIAWNNVTPSVTQWMTLTDIETDPAHPNRIWASFGNVDWNQLTIGSAFRQNRVWYSDDYGNNWTNVSKGLPALPIHKVLYVKGSDDLLFAATDIGVYRWNKDAGQWECFNDGMPRQIVTDIEMNYCSGRLRVSTYGRGIWESEIVADPASYAPGETNVISSNTTWSSSKTISGSIRVKAGVTLTISGSNTTIYMPRKGKILVEPRAKLIIDGATITNNCTDCLWRGIEVGGDNTRPSDPQYQGALYLQNGATLEHAQIAIRNYTLPDFQCGGIIEASNSHIDNCDMAVSLNNTPNYKYTNGTCTFDHVTFIRNDLSIHVSTYGYFTSWNVAGGVLLTHCTFKFDVPWNEYPYIQRYAAVSVQATEARIDNCSFDGFYKGVYAWGYQYLPTRTVKIYDNTFTRTTKNIVLAAQGYGDVRGNIIDEMYPTSMGGLAYDKAVGIYIDRTMGSYIGCHNQINGAYSGGPVTFPLNYGIIANKTAYGATQITDNDIANTTVGTQTQDKNPLLDIFCNHYQDNDYAWAINPQTSSSQYMLKNQGTGCSASDIRAGNTFTGNAHDIQSYLANSWTYWAGNGTDEVPGWSGNMNMVACSEDGNSQCDKITSCVQDWSTQYETDALQQYYALKVNGQGLSTEALLLYGQIIRGYNSLDDIAGLRTFLEDEDDDRARKLLIPLYIEENEYDNATEAIADLDVSEAQRTAYSDYYGLIHTIHQTWTHPDTLTATQLRLVTGLAADTFDVSPLAKGLLELAANQKWEHVIEELPVETMSYKFSTPADTLKAQSSLLLEATPNPASEATLIHTVIIARDAARKPTLVIRDINGREIFRAALSSGDQKTTVNTRSWNPGIYFYSLWLNGKAVSTRKLSIK